MVKVPTALKRIGFITEGKSRKINKFYFQIHDRAYLFCEKCPHPEAVSLKRKTLVLRTFSLFLK